MRIIDLRRTTAFDPLADIASRSQDRVVANVVLLAPNEEKPDFDDGMRWLEVAASDDHKFHGSGGSWKTNGDWVGYRSLAEDDVCLETALAAAQQWASKYDVPTIWVQLTPNGS